MSVKLYLLRCGTCDYKRWSDGSDLSDLVMVTTCRDCGGAKKFKCPGCGRLISAKKFQRPADASPAEEKDA